MYELSLAILLVALLVIGLSSAWYFSLPRSNLQRKVLIGSIFAFAARTSYYVYPFLESGIETWTMPGSLVSWSMDIGNIGLVNYTVNAVSEIPFVPSKTYVMQLYANDSTVDGRAMWYLELLLEKQGSKIWIDRNALTCNLFSANASPSHEIRGISPNPESIIFEKDEIVKVPAGEFATKHYVINELSVWLADYAPAPVKIRYHSEVIFTLELSN